MNAPIQGTAADIVKRAMIRVDEMLRREHLRGILLGMEEGFARPFGGALGRSGEWARRHGHGQRLIDRFLHRRSTPVLLRFEKGARDPGRASPSEA
jgi:hypothetical protein